MLSPFTLLVEDYQRLNNTARASPIKHGYRAKQSMQQGASWISKSGTDGCNRGSSVKSIKNIIIQILNGVLIIGATRIYIV